MVKVMSARRSFATRLSSEFYFTFDKMKNNLTGLREPFFFGPALLAVYNDDVCSSRLPCSVGSLHLAEPIREHRETLDLALYDVPTPNEVGGLDAAGRPPSTKGSVQWPPPALAVSRNRRMGGLRFWRRPLMFNTVPNICPRVA